MSILLSIRLFSNAKAPFALNVFMTPMHTDRAFGISSVPCTCTYHSWATCRLSSDTSDDTLIRFTGLQPARYTSAWFALHLHMQP